MRFLIAASILLTTVACSSKGEFDLRVLDSDENYMSDLAIQLDAADIAFRARRDGSIAYRSRDEQAVKSIEQKLKKDSTPGTYAKFESEEPAKQLIMLLDAGKMPYRVEGKPDGDWIRWQPRTDEEARKIIVRALQNSIAARAAAKK